MRKVGGRASVPVMETLEGRQLLSVDVGAPAELLEAERSLNAMAAMTEPIASAGTITSVHIASTDV